MITIRTGPRWQAAWRRWSAEVRLPILCDPWYFAQAAQWADADGRRSGVDPHESWCGGCAAGRWAEGRASGAALDGPVCAGDDEAHAATPTCAECGAALSWALDEYQALDTLADLEEAWHADAEPPRPSDDDLLVMDKLLWWARGEPAEARAAGLALEILDARIRRAPGGGGAGEAKPDGDGSAEHRADGGREPAPSAEASACAQQAWAALAEGTAAEAAEAARRCAEAYARAGMEQPAREWALRHVALHALAQPR